MYSTNPRLVAVSEEAKQYPNKPAENNEEGTDVSGAKKHL
jgi:hypothetical protein